MIYIQASKYSCFRIWMEYFTIQPTYLGSIPLNIYRYGKKNECWRKLEKLTLPTIMSYDYGEIERVIAEKICLSIAHCQTSILYWFITL